ncbi:hypothetical protein VKI22_15295 [Cyanobacterium aponinum UTEX 3221]|uniref:Uncharacterized protein n=1 Tax=Cyanobacterium aponinum (strain PCC 10605) TaxID=755178 RepID=K9Z4A7_CYAAP|nr:hypothetical protein [Cyanobacterium aponinum]AFZ53577.1 hypothetical protein Cyan10605_1466 [Cyanobacterium aponinum PCC 10605]WRL37967.1 hypothetical protein VKI22_15295 [Cyanobacterium aponinum UTEX 3221]
MKQKKDDSPLDIILDAIFDLFKAAFGKKKENKPSQYFLYGFLFLIIALAINYFFSIFLGIFTVQENLNSSLNNILSLLKIIIWIINAIFIGSGLMCFYRGLTKK